MFIGVTPLSGGPERGGLNGVTSAPTTALGAKSRARVCVRDTRSYRAKNCEFFFVWGGGDDEMMALLGRSSQAGETSVTEGGGGKMGQLLQYNLLA